MADGTETQSRDDPNVGALKAELEAEKRRASALAARNAALEARKDASGESVARTRRGHRFWVALLLVLGFLLTPITIVVLFAHTQITDTSRYVSTIKPLASDPAVQAYAADQVTNSLFEQVDVRQYVAQTLPPRAEPLIGPLTSALKSFTHEATLRLLQSKQFQTVWVEANRSAHAQINNLLSGTKSGAVSANQNGAVTLDLSVLAQRVKTRLESTGIDAFSRIPADRISGRITIFESKSLYKARRGFQALNRIAFVLPFLVFACFGGAILLSRNRRRGFIKAAVAFTLGALVLALLLKFARGAYLDGAVNQGIPHDAAASVYDTLIRLLQTSMRSVLTFSILVVIVAVLAGPSRLGVWFRSKTRNAALWVGEQTDRSGWTILGPVPFVVERKKPIRIGIAVVGFLVLFLWNRPTPIVILWIGVAALVLLALVELLGRDLTTPVRASPSPA